MTDRKFIAGHATTYDGERVALTEADANAIWEACELADQKRREVMPDSMAALRVLQDARTRLRDEGWRGAQYCPKDGSEFAVIQYGSTGIFRAFYNGLWPSGQLFVQGEFGHPSGHLWKPLLDLTEAERAQLDECEDAERRVSDAHTRSMAALSEALHSKEAGRG